MILRVLMTYSVRYKLETKTLFTRKKIKLQNQTFAKVI